MRKRLVTLAFLAILIGVTQTAGSRTRVSFGFSYGYPYYQPVYSYRFYCPSSAGYRSSYPGYRVSRHRPYHSRVYPAFRHRARAYAVRPCWY